VRFSETIEAAKKYENSSVHSINVFNDVNQVPSFCMC